MLTRNKLIYRVLQVKFTILNYAAQGVVACEGHGDRVAQIRENSGLV